MRGALHDLIHGLPRSGRSPENRAAVFLHRLLPSLALGCALIEFRFHSNLSAEHAIPDLRDQLLESVGLVVIESAQAA